VIAGIVITPEPKVAVIKHTVIKHESTAERLARERAERREQFVERAYQEWIAERASQRRSKCASASA
jgi:hypothetical protein